ncbi:GldG family protein, partial [Bdellovibrionota bacterium FG-2]
MQNNSKENNVKKTALLWVSTGVWALGLLVARTVYPELLWLTAIISILLVASLGGLIRLNRQALRGRTAAYGLNAAITVLLVLALIGVINFLGSRYPQKLDLTKNKVHTLSDQTVKVIKGLQKPVKATLFSKVAQKEQFRPLLEDLKGLNPKFEVEFTDPDREPLRAKQLGIKKYGTLNLVVGARETRVEDPTEEKITNALLKMLKEKPPLLCTITGHGEHALSSTQQDGYDSARKALTNQAYEFKEINLTQETAIPGECGALAIFGPNRAFFPAEVKLISDYLDNGGRAIIALDINTKGDEYAPELHAILEKWNIKAQKALIVDPLSRMLGVDAAVPILASFAKDQAITKEFQGNCYFPFLRPLEVLPNAPASLKVQWIAQTTPKSWAVTDMKAITSGQVEFNPAKDKGGPLSAVIVADGKLKDSKATKNTRLVVFGTSQF